MSGDSVIWKSVLLELIFQFYERRARYTFIVNVYLSHCKRFLFKSFDLAVELMTVVKFRCEESLES